MECFINEISLKVVQVIKIKRENEIDPDSVKCSLNSSNSKSGKVGRPAGSGKQKRFKNVNIPVSPRIKKALDLKAESGKPISEIGREAFEEYFNYNVSVKVSDLVVEGLLKNAKSKGVTTDQYVKGVLKAASK